MRKINLLLSLCLIILFFSCKEQQTKEVEITITEVKETAPDPFILKGEHHFLHGYTATNEDKSVNVVVEIPTGTVDKWEVGKNSGHMNWQQLEDGPRRVKYLGYPGNYGMIPQTYLPKELGGDGDPLDVIVLGPAVERGSIVECKIIGVLELLDRGEQDDKLIAVMKDTPFYEIENIAELNEHFKGSMDIITLWFANYKGPDKMEIQKVSEKERALEILDAAMKAYQEANQQ